MSKDELLVENFIKLLPQEDREEISKYLSEVVRSKKAKKYNKRSTYGFYYTISDIYHIVGLKRLV